MKKAVGYIRVSTDGQAESGLSLEAQKAKIEAYASLKDLDLVEIIEDAGISAKNLKRPGIQKIMELVRKKEIDAVVILKLDRMFRNTIDALNTSQLFQKHGVALHSIFESLDTDSAIGNFFFTLLAALGEMERKLIGERTKTALTQKKARGEKTGGYCPYGWTQERGKLVENEKEQQVLTMIKDLQAKGLSCQKIADKLNANNILTKLGSVWSRTRVYRIMKNAA